MTFMFVLKVTNSVETKFLIRHINISVKKIDVTIEAELDHQDKGNSFKQTLDTQFIRLERQRALCKIKSFAIEHSATI